MASNGGSSFEARPTVTFDEDTLTEFGEKTLDSEGTDERRVPALRRVYDGGSRERRSDLFVLSKTTRIGRSVTGSEDIQLPTDAKASRKHVKLTVEAGGGAVRLINESRNGTKINGGRVDDEAFLSDNDVIRVGDTCFVFRWYPEERKDCEVEGLLGAAPAIATLRTTMELVGKSQSIVLLLGETGVGKEVVARGLHALSDRKGEFVPVNCGAIPESLAESQLFGHVKGSFTGANEDHEGYFRAADGGTLFLDEVGELSEPLQPKLLRVLDTSEVYSVGATKPSKIDVRVIAATNRDLLKEVNAGGFRGDLYARLAEITLQIPPLRDRREDVLTLLGSELGDDAPPIKPALAEALLLHPWPFNVREAIKVARDLKVRGADSEALGMSLVKGRIEPPTARDARPMPVVDEASTATPAAPAAPAAPAPIPSREELESLLREHKGIISRVARATGRSRTQVYRWLEQYELDPEQYRA
jgi:DNA-binding NtrC family response regulator